VDAYLYTDRGVYRPGETVHLNALLRDREARAVKDRKGAIIGAVGITGDTSDNDELAAVAGIEAAGFTPDAG